MGQNVNKYNIVCFVVLYYTATSWKVMPSYTHQLFSLKLIEYYFFYNIKINWLVKKPLIHIQNEY